jgi:hypothetical protein
VSYLISNSTQTAELVVAALANNSQVSTSDPIRLRLIATTTPIVNGVLPNFWILAEEALLRLPPQTEYVGIDVTVPYMSPPDGIYYIALVAFELEGGCGSSDGACPDWYWNFPHLAQVLNGQFALYVPPAPTTTAVEYYYAAWGYYFVTAFPAEIAALDGGAFGGVWQRTGNDFLVWPQTTATSSATCRFFSVAFPPRSSHFYTPFDAECASLKLGTAWQYEGIAFYIEQAEGSGICPVGTIPLYRLYNNGMGGSPNHRYTTSLAIFNQMIAAGWLYEGNGNTFVFACVPG